MQYHMTGRVCPVLKENLVIQMVFHHKASIQLLVKSKIHVPAGVLCQQLILYLKLYSGSIIQLRYILKQCQLTGII